MTELSAEKSGELENDEYRSIASGFSYALLSIIGSRLLFQLKEIGERDVIINSSGGQPITTALTL